MMHAIKRLRGLVTHPLFTLLTDGAHAGEIMRESIDDYRQAKLLRQRKRDLQRLTNEQEAIEQMCLLAIAEGRQVHVKTRARRVLVMDRIREVRDEIARLTPRGVSL